MKNFNSNKVKEFLLKNSFPLFGLGALIWFLIRVIPKPTRASYPCMKVAAPMASSFVLWLIGLTGSLLFFRKMQTAFKKSSYVKASLFLATAIIFSVFTLSQNGLNTIAKTDGFTETVKANNPIGEAKGINPGRVVWVWNPYATNENCTNKFYGSENTPADETDDGWFLDKNNDQVEIDKMLSASIQQLTNEETDNNAWDAIFTHFNENKHSRSESYLAGEKIFIKINATSTWGKGEFWGNITDDDEHMRNGSYGIAETSPHVILALLRQLVNVVGVAQEDISIGDPMKFIYANSFNRWNAEFPNIHYIANQVSDGRELAVQTSEPVIKYSDKGSSMDEAVSDKIYTKMYEADYLINVPTMKAHARAGITLFAKNHFGSHTRSSAEHLHKGLVAPENAQPVRTDSSMYRVQVDLMGHEKFGGNQVLFLLDALYSGSEATDPPTKWDLAPFNGDWTSSIFVSQDPVAIESVAYDFLSNEYDGSWNMTAFVQKVNYPHMNGSTDYLRQAASSDFWPEGISYDPEDDGTPIGSLGVNEHWNNPADKQYSRNLNEGDGIELVTVYQNVTDIDDNESETLPNGFILNQNYPNPFNPTTTISFNLEKASQIKLEIYDTIGRLVTTLYTGQKSFGSHKINWNGIDSKGRKVSSGNYIYRLTVLNGSVENVQSKKMTLLN
ncbi:MAG: DUF362 domain-containing protein [Melioribacteraceae bacterium]|nr:DUF362 domain-containing protein [Melioribacteraceae bacterium]